jgi:predicted RNA-binding Zn-ribbon protein involved in translation (DUF1610 family)
MIKNEKEEIDKTIINQKERDSCPKCGSIRIIERSRYYRCLKCGWKGNSPKKVMWYFGISYRGDGPSVGRIINPSVRDRNSCPKCSSMRVRKRVNTYDYFCDNCGWTGKNPKKMRWGVLTMK